MKIEDVSIVTKIKDYNGRKVYVSYIREYPDCISQGNTFEESYNEIVNNFVALQEYCHQTGKVLSINKSDEMFSGKFALRIPKSLHKSLSLQAELNEVSLNTYIINLLSKRNAEYEMYDKLEKIVQNMSIHVEQNSLRYIMPTGHEFKKKLELYYE